MFKAVLAYLDNLIAWGNDLFRQDTGETINEATQIYVLAALILGERPQAVLKKGSLAPLKYASRRDTWDEFGNTLEKMESEIPFDLTPFPMSGGAADQFATLRSIGTSLYFCVPRNDKLMTHGSRKFGAVPNIVVRSCALSRRDPCGANGWTPRGGPRDRCRRGASRRELWP
jgi:hypothetical protein